MKIGVVGLPNVGKSTLFNALTRNRADSANYPFCTIEPNIGIVNVPDARVDFLADFYKARSVVHATIEFVDIAGLVKGAASGAGLGNKFLANIRESDAIVHVVRAFANDDIVHVDGDVDPARDIATINLELILSDLETVARRIEKAQKQAKGGGAEAQEELALATKFKTTLDAERPANETALDEKERALAKTFGLLTLKPVIYCANVNEADIANDAVNNPHFQKICDVISHKEATPKSPFLERGGTQAQRGVTGYAGVIPVCAKIEEELSQIDDPAERKELMEVYGLSASGLDRLVAESYRLLGLISYLTAGEPEVRAWTITKGTRAPQAAGKIHTDFERGFIRAEVISYDEFVAAGTLARARETGKIRSEGKDYVVRDGDIIHFKFNV